MRNGIRDKVAGGGLGSIANRIGGGFGGAYESVGYRRVGIGFGAASIGKCDKVHRGGD